MKRLPPLNALRAFEAAARHKSFTAAAGDLFVTHGAVSRQIQHIEEFLGVRLFERLPRGVELTDEGREYAAAVRGALEKIAEASDAVRTRADEKQILTISTTPRFAVGWLMSRLHLFQRDFPQYGIRISSTTRLVNFERERIDVAIRYGRGDWPGLFVKRLFKHEEVPVCAPALLNGPNALTTLEDLEHVRLLHDGSYQYWVSWLEFVGIKNVDARDGWVMDDPNALFEAAIQGQGVALANPRTIERELRDGELVRPFDIVKLTDVAVYAVCPEENADDPKIRAAIDLQVAQAEEQEEGHG
ncbi:MAG: transcriptional regulator GcvA [Gammaproteobacteria bacterium]|nr:transcriptional regulator GcvA [Gammaproteobacteria bacterium]